MKSWPVKQESETLSEDPNESGPTYGLQESAVYGPIQSRRLGYSLGINPLPLSYKLCNFDCAYCQYGFTEPGGSGEKVKKLAGLLAEIETAFRRHLEAGTRVDCITIAGNGEPTLYPDFLGFVQGLLELRNRYYPGRRTGILSNSSLAGRPEIRKALAMLDDRYMKLDAGHAGLIGAVNQPRGEFNFEGVVDGLKKLPDVVIQSLFVSGAWDNSGREDVDRWIEIMGFIRPREVQIYSIDRRPADPAVVKVGIERLEEIAAACRSRTGVRTVVFD